MVFDLESISTVVFLIILGILVWIDRKNIEFKYVIFVRRVKKGKEWIYATGAKYKTFFKYFGTLAAIAGIGASLFTFYAVIQQAFVIITNPQSSLPGLRPIIPSIPSTVACSFAFCVPFWFWIIGVLVVLVSHEMSHALVSRSANIRVKSFGLISILILPGAFVEPDENQLKKSSSFTKLKVYAAGSFANLIVFAIFYLVTAAMFSQFYLSTGVQFEGTIIGSPAANASLTGTIQKIDNTQITDVQDFENFISKINPETKINITTNTGNYSLITSKNSQDPTKSFIGISGVTSAYDVKSSYGIASGAIDWIFKLFGWLWFLNLGIGLFNLLPIKPLDGGLMYEEIIKMIFRKPKPNYMKALSIFTFILIIINIIGPYLPRIIAAL